MHITSMTLMAPKKVLVIKFFKFKIKRQLRYYTLMHAYMYNCDLYVK